MHFFKKTKFSSLKDALQKPHDCKNLSLFLVKENFKDKGDVFSEFINLEKLKIQGDHTIYDVHDFELPKEIANLPKLKYISLLNLPFNIFPEWITSIKSLQHLTIRGSSIDSIPDSVLQLNKLKTLRIENCDLNKLPKKFNHMENLKILGLRDTKLTYLDSEQFPKNLKEINFSGSKNYEEHDLQMLKIKMKKTIIYP